MHRTTPAHIDACIARNPTKRSAAKPRRAQCADVLLGDLEHRFVALLEHQAFEADVARRRRSNHVAYTYGDVVERAARTADEVRSLLAYPRP